MKTICEFLAKPYLLSGKLFCGYCGSLMTAETGTSKTGKVHRYYKCFNRKRNASACGKKNYRQKDLEDLVFNTTAEYVLKPDVIERIAEIVVERFNAEITKPAALTALESEWKETEKGSKGSFPRSNKGSSPKRPKKDCSNWKHGKKNWKAKSPWSRHGRSNRWTLRP